MKKNQEKKFESKKNKLLKMDGSVKLCLLGGGNSPESLLNVGDSIFTITAKILLDNSAGGDRDILRMNEWFLEYKRQNIIMNKMRDCKCEHHTDAIIEQLCNIPDEKSHDGKKKHTFVLPYEFTTSKGSTSHALDRIIYRILDSWDMYEPSKRYNMVTSWALMCEKQKALNIFTMTEAELDIIREIVDMQVHELILYIFVVRGKMRSLQPSADGKPCSFMDSLHLQTYKKFKPILGESDDYKLSNDMMNRRPSHMLELIYQTVFILNAFFIGIDYVADPWCDWKYTENPYVSSMQMMMTIPDEKHRDIKRMYKPIQDDVVVLKHPEAPVGGEETDTVDGDAMKSKKNNEKIVTSKQLMTKLSSIDMYAYRGSFAAIHCKKMDVTLVGLLCDHCGIKRLIASVANLRKHSESQTMIGKYDSTDLFYDASNTTPPQPTPHGTNLHAITLFDPFLNMTNIVETTAVSSNITRMYGTYQLIVANKFASVFTAMVEKHYPEIRRLYEISKGQKESLESFYIRWMLFEFWFVRRFVSIPMIDLSKKGTDHAKFNPSDEDRLYTLELVSDARDKIFLNFEEDLRLIELQIKAHLVAELSVDVELPSKKKVPPKKKNKSDKVKKNNEVGEEKMVDNENDNLRESSIIKQSNRFDLLLEDGPKKKPVAAVVKPTPKEARALLNRYVVIDVPTTPMKTMASGKRPLPTPIQRKTKPLFCEPDRPLSVLRIDQAPNPFSYGFHNVLINLT